MDTKKASSLAGEHTLGHLRRAASRKRPIMNRQTSYDNQRTSQSLRMTTPLFASPPAGSEVPGPTVNQGESPHATTRRYSTLGSHPFATSNTVDEGFNDASSSSTEYFGQIDFDRPKAKSNAKGKERAMGHVSDNENELGRGDVEGVGLPNGVDRDNYPHANMRRQESPRGASVIKTYAESGSSSANLFYQPQPQLPATHEEFQDVRSIYRAVNPSERTLRSVEMLSDINTALHPGYGSAIPMSAAGRAQGLMADTPSSAWPISGLSHRPDHMRSKPATSSTSTASAYRRRDRIPSREILQAALDLAQKAVEYDGANDIPAALSMYREAVSKLRNVMGRVGMQLEPISPDLGIPELCERENDDISMAARRRKAGTPNRSEEEGKTLKGIVSIFAPESFTACFDIAYG
ncbi:hypothetical protein QFC22_001605 [Naganishia vaughanmartiniae]|uniref:Uncharacterized protein n=1 Tax=Naganishia vaughanmartiniae TaxID=1424756 RepID=A0ACC2XHU1_9TREE|nr:hypothetical protein QFC22_001605 [Naganishia vaughanmartiniae]